MYFRDVLTLVAESNQPHGALEKRTEVTHEVFCTVRSVGMNEAYQAMSYGLNLQYVFILSDWADYNDEKIVEYKSNRYRVVRTYRNNQAIELTCERITVDGRSEGIK